MPGLLNTYWGPGAVHTNWGPGLVDTDWGPGLVNTDWGPGLEVGAGTKGQGRGPGNTNTLKRIKTGENYAETIIAMAENVRTSSTTKQILTTFNELKARCRYC